jgi:HD-GYP domain-containing protein (c-di-GMP phosphodiesterase class II)
LNVLHHHERVDGRGYPFEIDGEQVPYLSRLILIVDTVDAMTQTRAYRKGLPMHVVYKELDKFSGSQFDGELVDIFIKSYQKLLNKEQKNAIITFSTKKAA